MLFVDTNVLLYAISTAPGESGKARIARGLLERTDLALSVQVLQEFYVQATRRSRADALSHSQAFQLVHAFRRFPVQDNGVALMETALASCDRYRISYWDAAILEAARLLGCRVVLSEDLTHDRDYDGVVVKDPFRDGQAPSGD